MAWLRSFVAIQSPKVDDPEAGRSDFGNQRMRPDTGIHRKMRKVLRIHLKNVREKHLKKVREKASEESTRAQKTKTLRRGRP